MFIIISHRTVVGKKNTWNDIAVHPVGFDTVEDAMRAADELLCQDRLKYPAPFCKVNRRGQRTGLRDANIMDIADLFGNPRGLRRFCGDTGAEACEVGVSEVFHSIHCVFEVLEEKK